MDFADLLFHEYADPFSLLDAVISNGLFVEFLDSMERKTQERRRWDFYINKLSPFDNRSWDEFNGDLDFETARIEKPKEEIVVETINHSFEMLNGFDPEGGE